MRTRTTITSKGQITLPIEIRRKLGLQEGDVVEFELQNGVGTFKRHVQEENPFVKWAGKVGGFKKVKESIQWQRNLRDEK